MEWKWTFSSPVATAEISKFAGILSAALSVQSFIRVWLFMTWWKKQDRLPCPSPAPGVCSNSCPLNWWYCPTISSSVIPFSSCLQFFLASGSFPVSWIFASGSQSIGASASASASVLPVNIQDWFPLGLTGLILLQSKGLSRIFSSTTTWRHQFFGGQPFYGLTLTSTHDYWKNQSKLWLYGYFSIK